MIANGYYFALYPDGSFGSRRIDQDHPCPPLGQELLENHPYAGDGSIPVVAVEMASDAGRLCHFIHGVDALAGNSGHDKSFDGMMCALVKTIFDAGQLWRFPAKPEPNGPTVWNGHEDNIFP